MIGLFSDHDNFLKARKTLIIASFVLIIISHTTIVGDQMSFLGLKIAFTQKGLIRTNQALVFYFIIVTLIYGYLDVASPLEKLYEEFQERDREIRALSDELEARKLKIGELEVDLGKTTAVSKKEKQQVADLISRLEKVKRQFDEDVEKIDFIKRKNDDIRAKSLEKSIKEIKQIETNQPASSFEVKIRKNLKIANILRFSLDLAFPNFLASVALGGSF